MTTAKVSSSEWTVAVLPSTRPVLRGRPRGRPEQGRPGRSEIPWHEVINARHRIIHEYDTAGM